MGFTVKSSSNSHWYSQEGLPAYEVPYADSNKGKAGQMRATTLKDARTMNLLPSVTNFLDIQAKPQLVAWKIQWAMAAVETTPRIEGESSDDFLERCIAEAEEVASSAARFGSRVHAAIEDYLVAGEFPEDEEIKPYFENWLDWAQANLDLEGTVFSERIVIGHGYAGRADLKVRAKLNSPFYQALVAAGHNPEDYGILDFKTRRWTIKKDEDKLKPPTYSQDYSQLSAYVSADIAMATPEEEDLCASWSASIIINSEDPTVPINAHVWDQTEMERGMRHFVACQNLWCIEKDYDPRLK